MSIFSTKSWALAFTCLLICLLGAQASAAEPGFFPWLWREQARPTLLAAIKRDQLFILAGGAGLTVLAHQQDASMRDKYGNNRHLDPSDSGLGSFIGSGGPGIAITLTQLYFDRQNGLQHARALAFTSLTAITTAVTVNRERPNGSRLSFPSGHTSSAFATATSLAYSYGWWAGVPAYATATFVAYSRISDNAHWFSDTVAAAALGIFWGRASALVNQRSEGSVTPVMVPGGAMVYYSLAFGG